MPKVHIEFDDEAKGSFWGKLPTDARTKGLRFPSSCPHCGQATTKEIRLSTHWVPGPRQILWLDLPVCARVRQPAWVRTLGVITGVFTIMAAFAVWVAISDVRYRQAPWTDAVPSLLALIVFSAATLLSLRRYFSLRWTHYGHKSMAFRFPDDGYAERFAELNRGRVE